MLMILISREYINQRNPEITAWGNEAVARQFYDACGIDGCQGDELYNFLDYFQSPGAGTLVRDYDELVEAVEEARTPSNTYWAELRDMCITSVDQILLPIDPDWRNGVEDNEPYGYATDLHTLTDNNTLTQRRACGFAVVTVANTVENPSPSNLPNGQIFFGTTGETDPARGGSCSFIQ
jgi:hypothetical protein